MTNGQRRYMSKVVIATAATLIVLTTALQAEIICTVHGGCWETGKKIRLPSSPYRGVDTTVTSRENPNVRQDARHFRYLNDIPARSPVERR
jgi:hypothetical protein